MTEPPVIPAVPNLRDVGGCPTRSGGRVRTGLLYRSSGLDSLAGADVEALARMAIRTVYDLRMFRPILDVRPGYLAGALDEVRQGYGTMERYFGDGLGVDAATQDALRHAFTG